MNSIFCSLVNMVVCEIFFVIGLLFADLQILADPGDSTVCALGYVFLSRILMYCIFLFGT